MRYALCILSLVMFAACEAAPETAPTPPPFDPCGDGCPTPPASPTAPGGGFYDPATLQIGDRVGDWKTIEVGRVGNGPRSKDNYRAGFSGTAVVSGKYVHSYSDFLGRAVLTIVLSNDEAMKLPRPIGASGEFALEIANREEYGNFIGPVGSSGSMKIAIGGLFVQYLDSSDGPGPHTSILAVLSIDRAPASSPTPDPKPPVYDLNAGGGNIWMKTEETIVLTYDIVGHVEKIRLTYNGPMAGGLNGWFSANWSEDNMLRGDSGLFGLGPSYPAGSVNGVYLKMVTLESGRVQLFAEVHLY